MRYGYVKISTIDKGEKRQIEALFNSGVKNENIYIDKMIGRNNDRPAWDSLMEITTANDVIVITELDRLGRSINVMNESYKLLMEKDVYLEVIENELLSTFKNHDLELVQPLVLEILSYFAIKEREKKAEKQKVAYDSMEKDAKGRRLSNKTNKPLGRPSKVDNLTDEQDESIILWIDGKLSITDCIKITKLSRSTLFKFKKDLAN